MARELATIQIERSFAQPPHQVWRALTEPALLARWWAAGDIAPLVGHRFTLDVGEWGEILCETREVEPGRRLVITFEDWTRTFTLLPEGTGTRLVFEQSEMDLDTPKGRFACEKTSEGWRHEVLPRLATVLREMAATDESAARASL